MHDEAETESAKRTQPKDLRKKILPEKGSLADGVLEAGSDGAVSEMCMRR